ncbi:hypothetical protein A9Q87_00100 [Flavobacteriales bacterium 34_180_T64]|nr:hypothetical protein A9Q87_00100 [Flavobacteriales bacterium 34_180_T64]
MKHLIFLSFVFSFSHLFSQSEINVNPFLPEIISEFPNVRDIAITPSNNEVVFSAQSVMGELSALITVKKTQNAWSEPKIVSFSGQFFDIEPFFSEDGLTLYFASNRPLNDTSNTSKDFDIWYVNRASENSEWSEPINLGAPINTEMDEFYPVITATKNIYFTLDNKALKRKDDIYVSEFINGNYTTPKALSDQINSEGYEFNAFISNDESFIIYTCYNRPDGFGSGDLYMSHKMDNGQWSLSKNMGELVNSTKMDYCPFVNPSSQKLYFTSKRNSTPSSIEKKLTIDDFQSLLHSYSNGLSRLYSIPFTDSKKY